MKNNNYRLLILFFALTLLSCTGQTEKINGVSFVASGEAINQNHVNPVTAISANYAAIMPFAFVRGLNTPNVIYNKDRQWFGETKAGAKQYIEELRKQNIKIMLKPQIWVWHGEFTGHIVMNSEEDWKAFETSYSKFILDYAQLAQELHIALFCIGTELEKFIENRPDYWRNLINDIKKIYKGKITYAANWDEFKRTPFWEQLDFIGIDAYFPVSDEQTPSVDACLRGWEPHLSAIKSKQELYDKPILFTEFGYRSVDYTAKEPWKSDRNMNQVNLKAQTNATQALFKIFWEEDWFAGGFVWKWFINHDKVGGINNAMFTPQNKPVEALIQTYYGANQ